MSALNDIRIMTYFLFYLNCLFQCLSLWYWMWFTQALHKAQVLEAECDKLNEKVDLVVGGKDQNLSEKVLKKQIVDLKEVMCW